MNDEVALLRAICEQPAEDTPRLVFADYLQECGDNVNSAWAFFIRAQSRLARNTSDDPEPAAAARVRLLNVPFWHSQWLARLGVPAKSDLRWGDWERGFPVSVSGQPESLRAAWPRIASRVPFTILSMTYTTDAAVEELVKCPELTRIDELSLDTLFSDGALGDRTFLALAACPFLANLRRLNALSAVLSDRGAEALLDSPHLAGLQVLRVRTASRHRVGISLSGPLNLRLAQRFGSNAAV